MTTAITFSRQNDLGSLHPKAHTTWYWEKLYRTLVVAPVSESKALDDDDNDQNNKKNFTYIEPCQAQTKQRGKNTGKK